MAIKDFSNLKRNWDNIQFEELRKVVDPGFNVIHDELSDCYYNEKPFRTYGILTKERFDKLHGLIFLKRDIVFHQENLKQLEVDRIPEKEYNEIWDDAGNVIGKKSDQILIKIAALEAEGLIL